MISCRRIATWRNTGFFSAEYVRLYALLPGAFQREMRGKYINKAGRKEGRWGTKGVESRCEWNELCRDLIWLYQRRFQLPFPSGWHAGSLEILFLPAETTREYGKYFRLFRFRLLGGFIRAWSDVTRDGHIHVIFARDDHTLKWFM